MRILHICSYYIGNKLYRNLFKQLSLHDIDQEVLIPTKNSRDIGKNQLSADFSSITYYYRNIVKKQDKFLYLNKINKQMREVEKSILANKKVDFIHAHTVFSDGGTAYKLYQKYGINYIVNVRNTDINTFYKYAFHLRPFMYKILLNAKSIVFISHAYKQQLFSLLPPRILSQIEGKCEVIPNGIEEFWHESANIKKRVTEPNDVALLFIGLIDKNKNLGRVIRAVAKLKEQGYKASLHVVGNGPLEQESKQLSETLGIDDDVKFHGYMNDKKSILEIMNKCDILAVPSFKETFGLVYIEAMSRGIPVIYSKGQGIDGFYRDGEVGFSVDPLSTDTISEAVKKILLNYDKIAAACYAGSKVFNWSDVSERYIHLYND